MLEAAAIAAIVIVAFVAGAVFGGKWSHRSKTQAMWYDAKGRKCKILTYYGEYEHDPEVIREFTSMPYLGVELRTFQFPDFEESEVA